MGVIVLVCLILFMKLVLFEHLLFWHCLTFSKLNKLQIVQVIYEFFFVIAFHIIVCGLDSIVARRWMNGMLVRNL